MTNEEKKAILDNIESISAESLFAYIHPEEEISLEEMKGTGKLEAAKRKKIEELKRNLAENDEKAWNKAKSEATIESYNEYLRLYPNGKYRTTAHELFKVLQQAKDNVGKIKNEILTKIKINPNDQLTPKIVNDHLSSGLFTTTDLKSAGIPDDIIDVLPFHNIVDLKLGEIPKSIPTGFTEVYFWGIQGSGKTCALAAILSHAHETGVLETKSGEGFHYMNQLKNIFRNNIGFLPPATSTEVTQCLPFELKDEKGKKHPIALIELSGEIFQCYYYKTANLPLPGTSHEVTFKTVTDYLNGPNRKLHFFVFDLSKDPRKKDEYGLCQDDYLNAAQIYFKEKNIFKNSTDAIYIVATKSDLLPGDETMRASQAESYLKKHFSSFVEVLKEVCSSFKINDNNELRVIPFSLGKVYFNYICKFNNVSSSDIIQILKEKTGKSTNSNKVWQFFNK